MTARPWEPRKLSLGAVIHGDAQVTSIDFHRSGVNMAMTCKDGSIHMVDSLSGTQSKKFFMRSHGGGIVKYTHHEACVLLTSEKNSSKSTLANEIRYLSMHECQYLRYFSGHTDKVTSISMARNEDLFMSASLDNTVCMWDFRVPGPTHRLSLPPDAIDARVIFGDEGVVFGVSCQDRVTKEHSVKLFDVKTLTSFEDVVPAANAWSTGFENLQRRMRSTPSPRYRQTSSDLNAAQHAQIAKDARWTDIKFSSCGDWILVNTDADYVLCLSSFPGSEEDEPVIIHTRKHLELGTHGHGNGVAFSADSSYILVSTEDNEVVVYDRTTGEEVHALTGHPQPVGCIACNPKYDITATACVNAALWINP
jgi:COMPASS component SWD2